MRIAYIARYKGLTLVKQRPVVKNLSLSNTIKIELIAKYGSAAAAGSLDMLLKQVVKREFGK